MNDFFISSASFISNIGLIHTISFIGTLVCYAFWRKVHSKISLVLFNPLLLSLVSVVLLLSMSGISYDVYMEGAQLISYLIEPAVVLLGYPLYLQLDNIRKHWRQWLSICFSGALCAICSSALLAIALDMGPIIIKSISTLCITTAIAMEVTNTIGGSSTLAALFVMIAGMTGSVAGLFWLNIIHVKSPMARGLAIGCSSHALGTATIATESMKSAAYASTSLIITAIITATLAPILLPVFVTLI